MGKKRRCFVISPIGAEGSEIRAHADDVFRFIIEPAMSDFGIEAVRSDQMHETGRITEQMFREIIQSDLCAVVLTYHNPNVFYELAVAQAAARPAILLAEKGHDLPFDVQDLRTVHYQLQPITRLVDGYYKELVKEQIRSIEEQGWTVPSLMDQYGGWPEVHTELQWRHMKDAAHPRPLTEGVDSTWMLKSKNRTQQIVIRTGDIGRTINLSDVKADAIVSIEDTYLQLDRYYNPSISGVLRFYDAEKSAGMRILRDCAFESIQQQIEELGIKLPVVAGAVVPTRAHRLAEEGVKYILHVAAMNGKVGAGYRLMDEMIEDCVRNVFDRFAQLAAESELKTILFPMIGAGSTRLELVEVARRLMRPIVECLPDLPTCETAYVLTWVESHRYAVRKVAKELGLEEVV